MGIEYSSVVDAPRDDVFAWHARPGAIHRLLPPWQPMSVVSEATSLADGCAVLGLPGGLRWGCRCLDRALRPLCPLSGGACESNVSPTGGRWQGPWTGYLGPR